MESWSNRFKKIRSGAAVLGALAIGTWGGASAVQAEDKPPETFEESIFNGKLNLKLRVRFEHVHNTGTAAKDGYAVTERIRLGYATLPYQGFSSYLEFEDVRAADDDRYNAAGQNANPGRETIADPKTTHVNQAYIKYAPGPYTLITGRQRIVLDDVRFVGDVGWRQNNQTFEAASFKAAMDEKLEFYYAYVWDVNRIFGDPATIAAQQDWESDSHLINLSFKGIPAHTLTAFAYLLEFSNGAAASHDTYGVQFAGSQKMGVSNKLAYVLSYATQEDNDASAVAYDADRLFAQASYQAGGLEIGGGYELQESDGGAAAFNTPLGTNHAWNGWADLFLTTPATGLEDTYVFVGSKLPGGMSGKIFYHWFEADAGGADLGEELDAVVKKPIDKNQSVLVKYAHFDGKSGAGDVSKFWLQWELSF